MIEFVDLSKTFETDKGSFEALNTINFNIKKSESFGIIGESGAGKSTLLRMINGLEEPSQGKVLVDGVDLTALSEKELNHHRSQIGMIFQHYNLLNNKTVEDNIHLPLKINPPHQALSVDQVLNFVGLSDKKYAYPSELSGGQKQRVGIARALITKPKILLLDEPSSALDQSTTDELVQVLDRVQREFEMTIVVVTHELGVVKRLCQRCAVLNHGTLQDIIQVKTDDSAIGYESYYQQAREVLSK